MCQNLSTLRYDIWYNNTLCQLLMESNIILTLLCQHWLNLANYPTTNKNVDFMTVGMLLTDVWIHMKMNAFQKSNILLMTVIGVMLLPYLWLWERWGLLNHREQGVGGKKKCRDNVRSQHGSFFNNRGLIISIVDRFKLNFVARMKLGWSR